MKLLTLIEIEVKKIIPWLISLFTLMTVLTGSLFFKEISDLKKKLIPTLLDSSIDDYVQNNGHVTLASILDNQILIIGIFILFAIIIICLGLYLWYKEWIGSSKRIYLLLSLKGQRTSILLSKLIVIILSVFVYYAIVLLNLGIGSLLLNTLLPDGLTGKHLVQGALLQSQFINFVLPLTMTDFIYKLLFVILMFGLISVFVLSDRSKRIFGIIFGIFYGIANIAVFLYTKSLFLFVDERFFVNFGFVLIGTVLSYGISTWLLNKKVSI